MAKIIKRRVCANPDGAFVVFLIGMRFTNPWKVRSWWLVFAAMPKMLKELDAHPELGLLGYQQYFSLPNLMIVQYWKSFEALEAYARNRDQAHLPAWQAFNKAVGSNGDVGIWHETYLIDPGRYETVYNNMPPFGLGAATGVVDAIGARQEARARIKAAEAA